MSHLVDGLSAHKVPAEDGLSWAHPLVRDWFSHKFKDATEPQLAGWPQILAGKPTLICAPTGSGKTLAAFLVCIDQLVRKAITGQLTNATEVLYVSPLKALSNDVQKNLDQPLAEIIALAAENGVPMDDIRTAVRTGDTLASERQKIVRKPPHILVTTPESLYILLTSQTGRATLSTVKTVIVDEIHAIADDKRGSHLALSLERLDKLVGGNLVRIGLSATQRPLELIADFLSGSGRPQPAIVDVSARRRFDLQVVVPKSPLGAVADGKMWAEIYDQICQWTKDHRSILVFVNTRKLAERMAFDLGTRLGEDLVRAHHGSLSRKLRLDAETKLKAGDLKVLVATASLELGIDIGAIDLVCQIGSPRSLSVAIQRIGRAGHWRGATPKGRIFVTTRDDLVECAALCYGISQGELDRIIIPEEPLDVLAQQLVACCSAGEWSEDDLYEMVRRAYPYRNLSRQKFNTVMSMLSEGIAARTVAHGAYLHRNQVDGLVQARRGSRMIAMSNAGAIPETALFQAVLMPEEKAIGTLDEDFAVESMAGDIFLLGTTSWIVKRVEFRSSRVLVEDAKGAPPTVPFWRGEAPGRTLELSELVGNLRQRVSEMTYDLSFLGTWQEHEITRKTVAWLETNCCLDRAGAEQMIDYINSGRRTLGCIPSQKTIVAERFFDESGGMQLVIHSPFGARINRAWGLALRKRFCRGFDLELQAAATNDGINISLSDKHSFPLSDIFNYLSVETVKHVLEQAALATPVFEARWRWDATRALTVLRQWGGKKVPPYIQRMRAQDLLAKVFPQAAACQDNFAGEDREIPDHPLVEEVMKDVLTENMDLDGLIALIAGIKDGSIETVAVDTPAPSPFSHEILNANPNAYLDDAPLEERRARAVELRRTLPPHMQADIGRLDAQAIEQVLEQVRPDVRTADEFHDLLQALILVPENVPLFWHGAAADELWGSYFSELSARGLAARAHAGGRAYWVCAERKQTFATIFPDCHYEHLLPVIDEPVKDREACVADVLKNWLLHSPPLTAEKMSSLFGLATGDVQMALLALERAGTVLQGHYTPAGADAVEWCERRILQRIHQMTIGALRKEIEPVTGDLFYAWLANWQRVAPQTQLSGQRGLQEVLHQLSGFEAPARIWEQQLLSRRITNYESTLLDHLCLSGAVGWGRLSVHSALTAKGGESKRAPIELAVKGEAVVSDSVDAEPARPDEVSDYTDASLLDLTSGENVRASVESRRIVPTSAAPLTFFLREDCQWMAGLPASAGTLDYSRLSHAARLCLDHLRARGASFFVDLVPATNLLKSEVENGLWELVTAGLVTADGFDNLRSLLDQKRRSGQGRAAALRPRHATGRWSLFDINVAGDRWEILESYCHMLLRRYGVVFRDLLARESLLPAWRDLYTVLRRMEDRGEVRGGRFVSGFIGQQFALPHAVESLRAFRSRGVSDHRFTVAAGDPLNLVGIIVPGEKISAGSNTMITVIEGKLVVPR